MEAKTIFVILYIYVALSYVVVYLEYCGDGKSGTADTTPEAILGAITIFLSPLSMPIVIMCRLIIARWGKS